MSPIGLVLYFALRALFWALLLRLVIEIVRGVKPTWRPSGLILPIAEIVMTVTDPPLKLVRKLLPPVRLGIVSLDLGWMLLMFLVNFLSQLVTRF